MRALSWLVGGSAAAVALYYWTRRDRGQADPSSKDAALPGRWVWPVGVWRGRKPEITDGFASKRRAPAGDVITHATAELDPDRRILKMLAARGSKLGILGGKF